MWYPLLRSLLFRLPAESAHHWALQMLQWGASSGLLPLFFRSPPACPVRVMGIDFPNPVGLAAGLDKNGEYLSGLSALGFGFIEIGTVTPKPQPGNPQPRLFRLPQSQALINRMGFNNQGVDALVRRLETRRYSGILGINIGKNKDTPLDQAAADYCLAFEKVYPHASYIVVNISSPNTQGLRELQSVNGLQELLQPLKDCQLRLSSVHGRLVPLVVKLAPDLADEALVEVAEALVALGADGVIATNTTITRPGLANVAAAQESGGLSGLPLRELALKKQNILHQALAGRIPLIGVGGIMNAEDACIRYQAGADLLQIYTGFIYEGPALVQRIVQAMVAAPMTRKLPSMGK